MRGRTVPARSLFVLLALLIAVGAFSGCVKKAAEAPSPKTGNIAVLVGTTSEAIAEQSYPDANIMKFDALADAVTALVSGKADFVVSALSNCKNYARHNDALSVLPDTLCDGPVSIAVNREETALLSDISRLVEKYRADGTLADMEQRWMNASGDGYETVDVPVGSGPALDVAISADREPMCFVQDGQYAGFDVELIRRIAADLGRTLVLHDMKFAAMVPSVVSGKTPVAISNITDTAERRQSVSFSPSYFNNPQVLLTRTEIAEQMTGRTVSLDSLNGKPIGVLSGTVFDQTTSRVLPDSEKKYFTSNADQIIALTQGVIAGFMADEPIGRLITAKNPAVSTLPERIQREDYAFAFQKTAEGEALRERMNEYLASLRADGSLDKLTEKWMDGPDAGKTMERAESVPAGENGTLRMAAAFAQEPFSYISDNLHVGFEMELITGFCKAYGYGLDISTANFDALIPGLVSGTYDIIAACITITEERAESVSFSDPIYNGGVVMMVQNAGGTAAQTQVPPETARIGSLTGSTCESIVLERFPSADYKSYNALGDCLAALKAGQLDYICTSNTDAFNFIRTDPAYKVYGEPLQKAYCNVAIAKSQPELLEKIDALLTKYKEDGTLEIVRGNWLREDGSAYVIVEIPERTDAPVLRVATCAQFEPTGFVQNGEFAGYDIELARRLAYDLGMRAEFIDLDFAALIPALQSGKADIILSNMTATPERAQSVNFTQPYYEGGDVLVFYDDGSTPQDETFFASLLESFDKNFVREARWKLLLSGIGITLLISVASAVFGSAVGFFVCMMRRSHVPALSGVAKGFIRILQGTPIVVLLMILYYVVFNKSGLDGVTVAIIAFGLNYGAYTAEMLRTGIDAVDRGQTEAAAAIGFTPKQTFFKIVFPQAARHFLPVMKGEFISLVKMTSVVGYVAVQDLTKASDIIRSRTYEAFFPLIVTAVIYFLLSWGLSSLLSLVEVSVDPKRRKLTLPDEETLPEGGENA